MAALGSRVLDNGLSVLDTEASHVYICSQEPATFTEASSTYDLGNKNWGAGNAFGAPSDATPNGRKVASVAITDGSVTDTGTASHYAVTDNANSRLLAANSLSASQAVTAGNPFQLPSFEIRIPNQ